MYYKLQSSSDTHQGRIEKHPIKVGCNLCCMIKNQLKVICKKQFYSKHFAKKAWKYIVQNYF